MKSRHFDIRVYKKNLRQHYKGLRRAMSPDIKAQKDKAIFNALLHMQEYHRAKKILVYVSMPIEVDTHLLIDTALKHGKTVAVPYCIDGTREMKFYSISSREELIPRTFGVLEPVPNPANELTDFEDSICIVPGLSFDQAGYRLGYGGGYYDRFLSGVYKNAIAKIGVCYDTCTRKSLAHGRFDMACDFVVSESRVRKVGRKPVQRRKNKAPRIKRPKAPE